MARASALVEESITAFQQGETVYEKSVAARVKRFPRWFSPAPGAVFLDQRLGDSAKVVYAVMGLQTKGNKCSIGVRYLGRLLGLSPATVKRRIDELVERGHLERINPANGQRGECRFVSAAHKIPGRCLRCGGTWKNLRADGICWVCEERAKDKNAA